MRFGIVALLGLTFVASCGSDEDSADADATTDTDTAVIDETSSSAAIGDDFTPTDDTTVGEETTDAAGDDDASDNTSGDDASSGNEAGADSEGADGESDGSDGLDLNHSTGSATLTIDGTTYRFGPADGSINVCTNLFGSLQVALPRLDDSGAAIDGDEITVELVETGSEADTLGENTSSFEAAIEGTVWVAGDSFLASVTDVQPPPLDLQPDGSSAAGTVTLVAAYDASYVVEADFEATCD